MSNVLSIALSGMAAASRRLEASAGNVANARSDGPLPSADAAIRAAYPAAYTAKRVDQVETAGGGTAAVVSEMSPGTVAAYDPGTPFADASGMVAMPNVNFAHEAVQQIIARYTFAMNAAVVRTEQQMMKSLLDIKT